MLLIIFPLMLLPVCKNNEDMHKTIYFQNLSDYKIYEAYSLAFPDTVTDPPGYIDIEPHSIRTLDEKIGYENLIKQNKEGKIILFVKGDDPYVIVKRYILTIDSLNKIDWRIYYQ